MPNALAYLVLAAWPLVCVMLFIRLSPARALIWSLLGAYLLLPPLPTAFDFPLFPPLSKHTLPNLTVFLIVLLLLPKRVPILPDNPLARGLALIFILAPIPTVLTNPEPLIFVQTGLPGLRWTDAIALPINQTILLLGFLMARPLLAERAAQRDLLVALVIAGLVYSLPMLLEVRLSPQMNLWVYGFYQHIFEQSVRGHGFRRLVFLFHGIWAAFFALTCVLAALALWRGAKVTAKGRYIGAACWMIGVLILCKTLAPMIYLALAAPLILFAQPRLMIRVAALMGLLAVSYPVLKGADLVPTGQILTTLESVAPERANSLAFRVENEDRLLERARQKPL